MSDFVCIECRMLVYLTKVLLQVYGAELCMFLKEQSTQSQQSRNEKNNASHFSQLGAATRHTYGVWRMETYIASHIATFIATRRRHTPYDIRTHSTIQRSFALLPQLCFLYTFPRLLQSLRSKQNAEHN
jgi:hypothetical protein